MPGCYICGSKRIFQEHHIIPRAYGGEEGPTVDLCANCHHGLHKLALQAMSKKPAKDTTKTFTDEQMLRAGPLIKYIVMAALKARENPDMSQLVTLTLKPEKRLVQMLHLLKTDAGFTNMNDFALQILKSYVRSKL